ncbi:hypothetical protein HMPREF1143_0277 [Peptoanaerobacter stomatis]|uniref:Uncharacterized protein n=1 Tax=Peptoanaerobacter stomatis TaxID=796937 RepID=J5WF74_9FIRM|nr:hypothetical protein HMPREF1143_0277 [Peptoanaerobacter stomatis]
MVFPAFNRVGEEPNSDFIENPTVGLYPVFISIIFIVISLLSVAGATTYNTKFYP